MRNQGSIFKRCGCVDTATGRRRDRHCPQLPEADHGSWYFACSAPNVLGRAERVRRGGFRSRAAAVAARDAWLAAGDEERTGQAWTVQRWLRHWLAGPVAIRPTTRLSHAGYI